MLYDVDPIISNVKAWVENVVIGLNFCPFAARPFNADTIRFNVSMATCDKDLLKDIDTEFNHLNQASVNTLETSLIIVPHMLEDFSRYADFLLLLEHSGWQGVFQVASFHPHYQFAGVDYHSPENLTNRAPYPIFHVLRESSVGQALTYYSEPEKIPEKNIETAHALTDDDKQRLFPYLKTEQ